jgi:single-stranded-DNA-specific exonuclease
MWIEPFPDLAGEDLRSAIGGHALVADILARRGVATPEAALSFLDPNRFTPSHPEELPDMAIAAERLQGAIARRERIAVWGDFDVDGQTATTVLVSALRSLGADVIYYIPDRLTESHGIRIEALERVLKQDIGVLLTCDTGITAHPAIDYARARGVTVLVTDHHELPAELPPAEALVNPKRLPRGHPLRDLPGVGVAYKLVELLDTAPERHLDLVALGIVADVAEQRGETRYLLQRGLERLRRTERVGLRAVFEMARIDPAHLSAEHIGFGLGPRLNALGRLGDANLAVELFTTNDLARARILAAQLEGLNGKRQLLAGQIYAAAQEQIARDPSLLAFNALVLDNPHWHGGVIGPVAGRLAEQYARPVVLIVTPHASPQAGRGSARSVPGCDISAALSDPRVSQHLSEFGGHPGAAGLAIAPENIPAFRHALSQAVEAVWDRTTALTGTRIDAYVSLDELSLELAQELERLAPFGQGNPPIHLACRQLTLTGQRTFGRNGEHRQVTVQDAAGHSRKITWWRGADQEPPSGSFDLACTIKSTDYLGKTNLEIEWVDARLIQAPVVEVAPALPAVEIMDWRNVPDARQRAAALIARGGAQVWIEGGAVEGLPGVGRHALAPAETLVIWSAPPGPRELAAALAQVAPRAIAWIGVSSVEDRIEPFLRRLAGLLKHDLKQRQGQVHLPALAAACGQRLATVRQGIE